MEAFDELFDIYFSGLGEVIKNGLANVSEGIFPSDEEMREILNKLMEALESAGISISELLRALLQGDRGKLEQLLREAGERIGAGTIQNMLQEGFFTRNLLMALGWGEVERQIEDILNRLEGLGLPSEQAEQIRDFLRRMAENFPRMAREFIRLEREKNNYKHLERFRERTLAERNFAYLSDAEIKSMQEVVKKLAEKLKTRVSIRRKRAKHGRLDAKATLRKSMSYGGVPFELVLHRRKKTKPELMLLCDISDSVKNASIFMLQFVYTIQELFSKVRSFVFVADLGEITDMFKEMEINEAIEKAWSGGPINAYTHSDYGFAFQIFRENYMPSVTGRTTVIIIGDGRNNYNDPKEWILKELKQKAKKIIWLNPESPVSWGFGDSEMDKYMRYCDMVEECRNLKQLTAIVDKIIL
jgi:uncharacterized protein with von Willebrand factor type A (vWA) domain